MDAKKKHELHFDFDCGQLCDPRRPTTILPLGKRHRRWEWSLLPGETIEEFGRPPAPPGGPDAGDLGSLSRVPRRRPAGQSTPKPFAARPAHVGHEVLVAGVSFHQGGVPQPTREAAFACRAELDETRSLEDLRTAVAWLRERAGHARVGTMGSRLARHGRPRRPRRATWAHALTHFQEHLDHRSAA